MYLNIVYFVHYHYRSPTDILGFSRETVVALITNIKGREWHRRGVANQGLKPEHPRANTTDDVECFFSIMRDNLPLELPPPPGELAWDTKLSEHSILQ